MADKRVCGICTEHGHTSVECPRRIGARKPLIRGAPALVGRGTVGSIPDVIYILPDAPPCPYCESYQVEIAMLKRRLADNQTIKALKESNRGANNQKPPKESNGEIKESKRGGIRPGAGRPHASVR